MKSTAQFISTAILGLSVLLLGSTTVHAQFTANPWIGANPEIQKLNPYLILDNTTNGRAGIEWKSGATSEAKFEFNEDSDFFLLDNDLDIDGRLTLENRTVLQLDGNWFEYGEANTGRLNYFPARVGIGTQSLGSSIDLGIDGGASTNFTMFATAENRINFEQGADDGYIRMIGSLMEFRNTNGDTEFTKSNLDDALMIIKNNGRVGIGTEDPSVALEVNGVINLNSASANTAVQVDGLEMIWVSPDQTYASWGFGMEHNFFRDPVRLGGSGVATPEYQLEVMGDADITGELTAASDMRLKEEITDVTNAIEKINQLRPKTYQFKTDEFPSMNLASGTKMGFLAQELETVLPELVSTGNSVESTEGEVFNSKSVNYIELIPLLTKAIQEQQEVIETLQKEVEALKKGKK